MSSGDEKAIGQLFKNLQTITSQETGKNDLNAISSIILQNIPEKIWDKIIDIISKETNPNIQTQQKQSGFSLLKKLSGIGINDAVIAAASKEGIAVLNNSLNQVTLGKQPTNREKAQTAITVLAQHPELQATLSSSITKDSTGPTRISNSPVTLNKSSKKDSNHSLR